MSKIPAPELPETIAAMAQGITAGKRNVLARAITLIESSRADHQHDAQLLLQLLLPHAGKAYRIGITGVPGAGKSTLIDQFGTNLTEAGHKVAVLAVDPSSTRSGGSILGDKTRMPRLAVNDNAFVRPSPSAGTLGGVARKTREAMYAFEAAGYDVIIVETVGIGQSETAVAGMVDFFLILAVAGTGDQLQGIKKGVIEFADLIAVNKADGGNEERARQAAADYRAALHILTPSSPGWQPQAITVSGEQNVNLDRIWTLVREHRQAMTASGEFEAKRRTQQVAWMHALLSEAMMRRVYGNAAVRARLETLEREVAEGRQTPLLAAEEILALASQ